jgi:hypothetical protein
VEKGRDPMPKKVRFTTWTLRYNQMAWVTVDGLEQHWTRARVDAEIVPPEIIQVTTTNVSALTFYGLTGVLSANGSGSYRVPALSLAGQPLHISKIALDGQLLAVPSTEVAGAPFTAHFEKKNSRWKPVTSSSDDHLRKRHGLQGPIDDAFMDSFIMVRPTGKPINDKIGDWTTTAMTDAIREWRLQFRGDTPVKDDNAVTDADIANSNLILWGDPRSNHLLARMALKLPIHWDQSRFTVLRTTYSTRDYVPVLIYPNPLNPKRYVVLNSGFTFADEAPTSNALQIPKLPDYAVLNFHTQAIEDAGFFDEEWQFAKYH